MQNLCYCQITKKIKNNVHDLHYYKIENGLNNNVYTYKRYTIYLLLFYNSVRFTFHKQ